MLHAQVVAKAKHIGGLLLALALGVFCARFFIAGAREAQWDFKIYYAAATAHARGLDPYDVANLRAADVGGRASPAQPFVYPPLALYVFRPFTWLPYEHARMLFVALKLCAFVALLALWQRVIGGLMQALLPAFGLMVFSTSALRDLVAGNVSLLEECLLWAAFALFVRGRRPVTFCVLVCASALFKLTPLAFLLLLFATPERRYVAPAGLIFLALQALPLALRPELTSSWLARLAERSGEGGALNPTLLSLLSRLSLGTVAVSILAGAAALAVAMLSAHSYVRAAPSLRSERHLVLVLLSTLAYALILPRMKDYSLLLLAPAAFWILGQLWPRTGAVLGLIAFELASTQLCPIYRDAHWPRSPWLRLVVCEYRGWLMLVATWLLFLRWLRQCSTQRGESSLPAPSG